jgi:hypothetical protein
MGWMFWPLTEDSTMTHHSTRTVSIWAKGRDACNGVHIYLVRTGTWPEVTRYLSVVCQHTGPRELYIENSATGRLAPLFAA